MGLLMPPSTNITIILLTMFILSGCVSHQYCVMPDGDEYHAYLEPDTELWVKNGDKEIKWNTKPNPGALEQITSLVAVSAANSITKGD